MRLSLPCSSVAEDLIPQPSPARRQRHDLQPFPQLQAGPGRHRSLAPLLREGCMEPEEPVMEPDYSNRVATPPLPSVNEVPRYFSPPTPGSPITRRVLGMALLSCLAWPSLFSMLRRKLSLPRTVQRASTGNPSLLHRRLDGPLLRQLHACLHPCFAPLPHPDSKIFLALAHWIELTL